MSTTDPTPHKHQTLHTSPVSRTEPSAESASGHAPRTLSDRPVLLVAGGTAGDWLLSYVRDDHYLIGADRGALYLLNQGLTPDAALGDFDSVNEEERERIRGKVPLFLDCDPIHKDVTDTEWAFDWAASLQPASITLVAATGTRFDHTLANVHLLRKASDAGIPCLLADEHNEIRLLRGGEALSISNTPAYSPCIPGTPFDQLSLLPLSEQAVGITLEGFRYPLHEAVLTLGQSLGISNVIESNPACIRLREGLLLVIQSRG